MIDNYVMTKLSYSLLNVIRAWRELRAAHWREDTRALESDLDSALRDADTVLVQICGAPPAAMRTTCPHCGGVYGSRA